MSDFDRLLEEELEKQKKKKKEQQKQTVTPSKTLGNSLSYLPSYEKLRTTDIAPVIPSTVKQKKEEIINWSREKTAEKENERTWFTRSHLFDDGWDFGDLTKTILGSRTDLYKNIGAGLVGIGEKVVDAFATVSPYLAQAQWNMNGGDITRALNPDAAEAFDRSIEQSKKDVAQWVQKDLYDEKKVADAIIGVSTYGLVNKAIGVDSEKDSVFGEKTDSLAQSGGQLLGQLAVSAIPGVGQAGGMAMMGVTAFGSEAENALNQGATLDEAALSATISAGAEILTEKLGGISFGGKTLTDAAFSKLSRFMTNKISNVLITSGKVAVDALAEGGEEIISGYMSAIGQKLTYMSDKEIEELFSSEDRLESFIVGVVLGGMGGGVDAVQSSAKGIDPVSDLSKNDKKVVDKVYKDLVAEEEQNGKVSQKRKSEIYDEVLEQMEKGYISTETIEEVLGGENYTAYQDTIKQENDALAELAELYEGEELKQRADEFISNSKRGEMAKTLSDSVYDMVKDSRLGESYRDRARRGQKFEADVTQYDEKQRVIVQKAIDSGVLNNTNRTHDMVDFVARSSAATGVLFDFTNNEKLKDSIFGVNGKIVDGYITENGITINVNSPKYINTIVGHEITHAFEGSEQYDVLEKVAFDFAKEKGIYKDVLKDAYEMYHGVKGYEGYEGLKKIKKEAVANLVGDYLFTDKNFINHLSAKHQNIFQKVWNEIKYMVKIARAGSDEAKKLLELQKAFEEAYRTANAQKTTTEGGGVTYSYSKPDFTKAEWSMVNRRKHSEFDNPKFDLDNNTKWMYFNEKGSTVFAVYSKHDAEDPTVLYGSSGKRAEIDNAKVAAYVAGGRNAKRGRGTLDRLLASIQRNEGNRSKGVANSSGTHSTIGDVSIPLEESRSDRRGDYGDGSENLQESKLTEYNEEASAEEQDASFITFSNDYAAIRNYMKEGDVGEEADTAPVKYSLSKDSDGKQLTNEQIEYFKDSKVVDENGSLKVMYHGTSRGGHNVFDPWGKSNYGLFGTGSYFTDSKSIAESYTKKGKGTNPQIYETYLNITNPLDMDAPADPAKWANAFDEVDFPESGTNEDFYRAVEEYYADQYMAKWEVAEIIRDSIQFGMGYDGLTHIGGGRVNPNGERHRVYIAFEPEQIKRIDNVKPTTDPDIRYSLSDRKKLKNVGLDYDAKNETVSYSMSSLEDAFDYNKSEADYLASRLEYETALAKSIAEDKENVTKEEMDKAKRYLDSLFLIHDMIAMDRDRLDYEAAVGKSAWVSNAEYGGSIDFSTLCAKRRLFTGTFDAIQNELPDTVLDENDFLQIRNMLLEKELESPCSMCYVEGSRAKHGVYVAKFLKEYKQTNPAWIPQIADFTSTTRLEQTRINHPEAYQAYVDAMNKLSQRKPKEASVRTDYRGEILRDFKDTSTVAEKNKNGGVRFNSFSDFEIIHAIDCMQVLTDMARVGLNGQAYTKVKEFAEAFGNTGLKINLSLVAKDVDENGKLIMDETNGMKYDEAMDLRNRYSDNVGTVIVVFNEAQLRAALADNTIDYVLPFHRSQWRKSQYTMMGLPVSTKDFTNYQNDRIKNPNTGRDVKLSKIKHISHYTNDITGETFEIKDNIMPNQYWDFNLDGRGNAQRYLDYINANGMTPKFNFLLDKVDGKWVLPEGAVGDGYFKVLIDFKMYNNEGWGSPQNPVVPEFNMPFIQQMLENYKGGHQAFPVAHDVVSAFVEGKKSGKFSLSNDDTHPIKQGNWHISGKDIAYEEIAPVTVSKTESVAPEVAVSKKETTTEELFPDDLAPVAPAKTTKEEYLAVTPKRKKEPKMVRVDAPFVQKTANILAEEPKVQKKKSGLWSMFKENVLDNGMVFEDLALKTKNRDLQAKWNFIRYSQSRAQKLIGDGADGVKSLNAIREEVEKSGKTQKFYEYLYHWLNVDRMTLENRYDDTPNKAVFGDSITADMSRATAVQLGKENPEFRKWAKDVYRYNRHLRNLMVDKGVISQETADLWAEMYPHYVPIRRVDDAGLNINVPLDTGRTGVNAPIKKATGGNSDILPLFDTMAQRTLQTYKAIAKNSFGVELKNTLGTTITKEKTDVDGVIDSMDNHEGLLQEGKNGKKPTFTVFENGEKVTFEITDEMYNAMKPASDLLSYTNPIANTISNVHRGLLTEYNPVFMTTNAIKDTQDILINSQHPVKTYANLPRATWELAKKGKWFREYMENGGEDNSYFDSDTNSFDTKEKGVRKLLGIPPLSWISKANNFIERTPRLAEYITSREAGRSIEVSMLDAARVTTNFAAGGKLTKFANRNGATFLNASVQGAVQQARNIREAKANGLKGWAQLAGKFALAGLPAVLLNGLMWDDDDDYEELSDYVKQNYYIVGKYGDGKFVRIPKGRTLAVIQNAIEQVANAATGNDEVDLKSFLELAISNLAPNNPIENNILAPIIQVAKNETWYGEDLVPTRLQDLPAAEQYDESTDAISKWLGEKLNISPYKINYLLDQYSGGIGDTVLPMLTPEAESGDNSFIGNMIAPLKSKFTTDSVMNNQNVSDFYDTKDELTTNAKASTATDEDILMNKYINSINAEISELYAKKREIQNSNYSDTLKYSMVRDVQKQIVELTREGLDTYKGVSINGEFATVGDRYFKKNEEGEWQKMSDEQVTKHKVTSSAGDSPYATDGQNHYRFYVKEGETEGEWRKLTDEQLEKQNEVTKGLGISAADYWGKKEEYDYAYEHPESYAVAKAVGGYDSYKGYSDALYDIKADKDENGKSINGSRKEKVIDYLNELDADYYTKIILFKNEYNADDTYNEEIVEYLDSRDDISYEEMVTILKKLGFTVSKDGTVTW